MARHFFERVGVLWENNPIIALRGTEEVPSMNDIRTTTVNIISTRSGGNIGISSTISTTQTTKNELFRAKSLFDGMAEESSILLSSIQKVLMEPVHQGKVFIQSNLGLGAWHGFPLWLFARWKIYWGRERW